MFNCNVCVALFLLKLFMLLLLFFLLVYFGFQMEGDEGEELKRVNNSGRSLKVAAWEVRI